MISKRNENDSIELKNIKVIYETIALKGMVFVNI